MIEDLFTPMHLLVLFAIVFFLFGAKRLPEIGKSLGSGIHSFRSGVAGLSHEDEELPPAAPAEPPAIEPLAAKAEGEALEVVSGEIVAEGETVEADDGGIVAEGDTVEADDGEIVEVTDGEIVAEGETVSAGFEPGQRAAS